MYKLAVISDLHADPHALTDALKQIERFGCDKVLSLGDLVDYSLFPNELIDILRERKITSIRGNHDAWAIEKAGVDQDLSDESLSYLRKCEMSWSATIEGVAVAAYHGSPKGYMDGIYPELVDVHDLDRYLHRAEASVMLVGHTHRQFCLTASDGRIVANPGSLLRDPADSYKKTIPVWDPEKKEFAEEAQLASCGSFGILELPSKKFTVHRAATGDEIEILRTLPGMVKDRRRDLRSDGDPIS